MQKVLTEANTYEDSTCMYTESLVRRKARIKIPLVRRQKELTELQDCLWQLYLND